MDTQKSMAIWALLLQWPLIHLLFMYFAWATSKAIKGIHKEDLVYKGGAAMSLGIVFAILFGYGIPVATGIAHGLTWAGFKLNGGFKDIDKPAKTVKLWLLLVVFFFVSYLSIWAIYVHGLGKI